MARCEFQPQKNNTWKCRTCGAVVHCIQVDASRIHRKCGPSKVTHKRPVPTTAEREKIALENFPCRVRGERVRDEPCQLCGARDQPVGVYTCEKFGECSLIKFVSPQQLSICTGCTQREPLEGEDVNDG